MAGRVAVVSCHVERPLDDECWHRFSRLQERRPGGFAIAALLRPPDAEAGEDGELWLARAREAAERGPLGHHTHFVGPTHARPPAGGGTQHAERVRREAEWLREHEVAARLFCGGGWYIDEHVAAVLVELGYADCTGTAFSPSYLDPEAPRLAAERPVWLSLPDGRRLLELPSTHSLGMAARAAVAALPQYVHVYFHDTDLLSWRRGQALSAALRMLARRCEVTDLEQLREASNDVGTRAFGLH